MAKKVAPAQLFAKFGEFDSAEELNKTAAGLHAQMVKEQNKKEQDIWKAENEKAFPNIRNNFKRLDKRYHYESGAYMIRPCKSASEIIDEGRLQHHCVGGESYLRKHNTGKSYILVLRKKDVPDMPFVTVEISTKFSVMQE